MAVFTWLEKPHLGKEPCKTSGEAWQCPNMKEVEGDLSMTNEHYECKVCGQRVTLDYDEIR